MVGVNRSERPVCPLKLGGPRLLNSFDRQLLHGNRSVAAGKLLLSDPLSPSCAGRVDPRFWAVDESRAANELREASPDGLAAHGARHYWDASVGELIDSGVEARAKTSATALGDNGHIAEIP